MLNSSRNPSLLRQFTYLHLKVIESRQLEVTKNPYYLLFPEWSQKKVSAHGLMWEIKISRKNWKYQHRENPQNDPGNLAE